MAAAPRKSFGATPITVHGYPLMRSGFPITDASNKLVGILTRRDLRFLENSKQPIREVMTKDNLVTARGTVTLEEAERILTAKKVEKLLLVDDTYCLTGIITIRDIDMMKRFPHACKDKLGRLRVGAAVGPAAVIGSAHSLQVLSGRSEFPDRVRN